MPQKCFKTAKFGQFYLRLEFEADLMTAEEVKVR
jgi:hypothetical protein